MLTIPYRLYVSPSVHIRILRVSIESDCSGAAFDHDVAAGAAICSPCQAGTYFTGSGWNPLLKSEDDQCLLVVAVRLGQDGDEESRVQNVTVRGAAVPGPEPVYMPCGDCACRWPGTACARADASKAACSR
jgi:hypothetical protein